MTNNTFTEDDGFSLLICEGSKCVFHMPAVEFQKGIVESVIDEDYLYTLEENTFDDEEETT